MRQQEIRAAVAGRLCFVLVIPVLLLGACSTKHRAVQPSSSAPLPVPVNPFTGQGTVPKGPVIAVKVDDTANGRPQLGIDQADIVYVEAAEGGVTRVAAIFATRRPVVEPVRSVRASDVELLSQYGDIVLVASGGGGNALPTVDKSKLHADIGDRGGVGFTRDGARQAPYNLKADLAVIAAKQTAAASAHDVGFTWSATAPGTAASARMVRATVGSTPVSFDWDTATHRYDRIIDGAKAKAADGAPVATPNVIVQFCSITTDLGDVDVTGKPASYTHTVGTGQVAVFRDGRRIDGTWTRSSADSGTTIHDNTGAPIPLALGGAWVLLVAKGTSIGP